MKRYTTKNILIIILFEILLYSCNQIKTLESCPSEMNYLNLIVFNCENNSKYPLLTTENIISINGTIQLMSYSQSDINYCLLINDTSLWLRDENKCLEENGLPYSYREKESVKINGYYNGEKDPYYNKYKKFIVVDVTDYKYICCNICCNTQSEDYNKIKKCFWYKPGEEKPFTYESVSINLLYYGKEYHLQNKSAQPAVGTDLAFA